MHNYLLDTNHAAALVTLNHPLRQRVLQRLQAGDTFAITVPVIAETLFGIGLLPRARRISPNGRGCGRASFVISRTRPTQKTRPRSSALYDAGAGSWRRLTHSWQ